MTINAVYVTLCFEYFSINNLLHKYNKLMQKIAKKAFRSHPKGFLSRYTG
ncbi:hypothetical protein HMPREF0020_01291 [Acinetobacter baumannii 6013113]|nr:hypothetical protein HMPREF0020_01291 [Acinetobacter baumannii 6013113]